MTTGLTKSRAREIKSLAQKKYRDELGTFVVEGARLMLDAAESDFQFIEVFHTAEFASDDSGRALLSRIAGKGVRVETITAREMEGIAETVHTQGILGVARQRTTTVDSLLNASGNSSVIVVLDAVSDPGNLGSIIRTCDWFGVSGVLIGRASVDLYNPKVVRATMGGMFHLPVVEDVDLLPAMTRARGLGYTIYVADTSGEAHYDLLRFASRSLIVFGNEAWGVSDQVRGLADVRVAIRRYGSAESLNVGVACGVILSGLHRLEDK
jgi:TrmH family RNA methyltransferase